METTITGDIGFRVVQPPQPYNLVFRFEVQHGSASAWDVNTFVPRTQQLL